MSLTEIARFVLLLPLKGFTTFIQPFHSLPLYQNLVGRLTEYSFSINLVSCMNDSFSRLKTSSNRLPLSKRLIHKPDANKEKKPPVKVVVYSTAQTPDEALMESNHQLKKKSIAPAMAAIIICLHVISCFFTPLLPIQDRPRKRTQNSFVYNRDENSPVVRWKLESIRSTIPSVQPISWSQP